MSRELVIYAAESISRGEKFSNFYGDRLVESSALAGVVARLQAKKNELNLRGKAKWQKTAENYRASSKPSARIDSVTAPRRVTSASWTLGSRWHSFRSTGN
jgi:hypothetical protein